MVVLKWIWEKLGPWLVFALVIAIIVMGIGAMKSCNKPSKGNTKADYFKKPGFKPDTIRIHDTVRLFQVGLPGITLPPKIVYKYDSGKYRPPIHDTTYIKSGSTLFTQTNNYDRLVYGMFNKDTIIMDLYVVKDNAVETKVYPVDFTRYRYQFENNQMNITELTKIPTIPLKLPWFQYTGTYIMETHDFLKQTDNIGFRSGINIWRIRLAAFGSIPIVGQNKQVGAGVAVGYRLF